VYLISLGMTHSIEREREQGARVSLTARLS
jgi:hypothetical protein